MKQALSMNPNTSRRIAYHKVFERTQIQDFLSEAREDWSLGTIDEHIQETAIRSVYTQPVALNGLFFDKLLAYVWAANQALWRFELTGLNPNDPPQLLQYQPGNHYEWHIDHDGRSSSRKLTCIVQLSDEDSYEGGDVCVFPPLISSTPLNWRALGTLIIFPVYVPHRVTKIESGVRHSLVFWIHGPEFR